MSDQALTRKEMTIAATVMCVCLAAMALLIFGG